MDKERKACNRSSCGNKMKCAPLNKETKRSPQISNRPGAHSGRIASPNAGNSTQILYVEPNFTETPSEYDIFYDCFSDVDISAPSSVVRSKRGQSAPPPGKDPAMLHDALNKVIIAAQTLLVEYERGGRKGRKGCGAGCRCKARNIKPQSRNVQLEVTAKFAASKTSSSTNIHIDPITFTIPMKLHLQSQQQHDEPFSESQQSFKASEPMPMHYRDQMPKVGSSMEPIRTATIMAPHTEVSCIPMEGPGQAFDLHAALLQQMTVVQAGFMPFPFKGDDDLPKEAPPTQGTSSKVTIQAPATALVSTTKKLCGEVCTIESLQTPSVDPFLTPSLAPVTKGPFLATIAASSVPSVAVSKEQQLPESASRGVCALCGKGGENSNMQPQSANRTPCRMCSKGKSVPPHPLKFPSQSQKIGCGKCSKGQVSPAELMPPMPKLIEPGIAADAEPNMETKASKRLCNISSLPPLSEQKEPLLKSSCGIICSKTSSTPFPKERGISQEQQALKPPPPPPLLEPLTNVKRTCGICSKKQTVSQDVPPVTKELSEGLMSTMSAPSVLSQIKPCNVCTKTAGLPRSQQQAELDDSAENKTNPCGVCTKRICCSCSRGVAGSMTNAPASIEFEKGPSGICSQGAPINVSEEKGACGVCSRAAPAPMQAEKGPCGICSRGAAPLAIEEKGPCGICSRGAAPLAIEEKGPCGICSRRASKSMTEEKGPCGICLRATVAPIQAEKGPCGVCSRGAASVVTEEKGPCICSLQAPKTMVEEKGPCGVCSRAAAAPIQPEKGPCGVCSRGAAPVGMEERGPCICSLQAPKTMVEEKGSCGVCSRAAAATMQAEKGPCGVCSRGAAPSAVEEKGPCGICSRGAAPLAIEEKGPCGICSRRASKSMTEEKGPCGICSRATATPMQADKGPCGICSRGVTPGGVEEKGPCGICSRRAPKCMAEEKGACAISSRPTAEKGPCGICSKRKGERKPCGVCLRGPTSPNQEIKGPCTICKKSPTPAVSAEAQSLCVICKKIQVPEELSKIATCSICSKPISPDTASVNIQPCGQCGSVGAPCGMCAPDASESENAKEPVPVSQTKYYKALPQHKDIHICSPCRYDPSPLMDEEGNVFCPHNCGCCLCPWRKRATDSQIEQVKHEKIKVCKCRMRGSIFSDYTSRAKCSNTSYFDCCPCREKAEAKYLEITGEEMWSVNERMGARIRGEPVNLEDVVEYKRDV
ncbi:uncharacterized protein LOC128863577 isoform X1 [Anastrepha ludens]|uniref:uncharacterized protein LOC128863577 isoform X1 n=2 Tax=Anastrepha ludens TaxID=28586 RepID=UPI0023AEF93C|nr:uncharacterized protein LOC128863577 isoform X1 [Anastrepha ludens]